MKRKGTKQSKLERDNAKWRRELVVDVGRCQNPECPGVFPRDLCVNEVTPGSSARRQAYDQRLAVNVMCGYCNCHLMTDYTVWPPQRQAALQIILCRKIATPMEVIDVLNGCRGDQLLNWENVSQFLQVTPEP